VTPAAADRLEHAITLTCAVAIALTLAGLVVAW
jgi:hypothetical protein